VKQLNQVALFQSTQPGSSLPLNKAECKQTCNRKSYRGYGYLWN